MKFDLSKILTDHRGEPFKETERYEDGSEVTKPLALGDMLERACVHGGNPSAPADVKFRQFKLAQRMAVHGRAELTAEDVVFLKELCAGHYRAIAYGAIVEALENPVREDEPVGMSLARIAERRGLQADLT